MGCSYFVRYDVGIRPDAAGALREAIGADDLGRWFSLDDGVLSCVVCGDSMSFGEAALVEEFTRGPVSDAAAESVLVTESCDGDETRYGIGPDAAGELSAFRLAEIRELAGDLTEDDAAALARELSGRVVADALGLTRG